VEQVLLTRALSKQYGAINAVNSLDVTIPKGSVYGILGPNGSGKTTTLGMVLGITNPTNGNFQWFGEQPTAAHRKRIGALLEQPNFYPYLTAYQNLTIICEIKQVAYNRIDEVLDFVDLTSRKNSLFKSFSTGMKQRLAIASALLNDPEVLVLDEPTNGLDPQGIVEVRQFIQNLADGRRTIILASHLLDEVEKVCTHVAVLKEGELLKTGTVKELIHPGKMIELDAEDRSALVSGLDQIIGVSSIEEESDKVTATLEESMSAAQLNKALIDKGIVVSHLAVKGQTLEDEFLALTENKS